jgi:uncharacterized protein (TIGR02118 family)
MITSVWSGVLAGHRRFVRRLFRRGIPRGRSFTVTVLRVCYKQGVAFDETYYFDTHIPMAAPIMTSLGMRNAEVVKVSGSVPGFSAPYQFVFSAHFDSPAALQQCMQDPRMGQVLGDVPNYFKGETDVMIGETV